MCPVGRRLRPVCVCAARRRRTALARIRDLPDELRPRERLLRHGADALSAAELVAVLLRTGSPTRSAVDVAADLIGRHGSLARLAAAGVRELRDVDGVGEVKALNLLAAFELGRRLGTLPARQRPRIEGPADAARLVMGRLRFAEAERFLVLLLNTRHEVLDTVEVTRGGLASSPVHPREVFKPAVREGAAAVILVHNHPSGDPAPSRADLAVTARLCRAATVMGIPVLDHMIIGDGRWVSLRERGVVFEGPLSADA
ncbi:MAG TPA: DNA repair protein RadC [bacterium]|nr:DNA repair protein RadC [bacterium]